MKEIRGDLFTQEADAICITTNGFVKTNGECVMGRGCAKQLAQTYPKVARILGGLIKENGNITQIMNPKHQGTKVIAFPVKPVSEKFTGANVVAHMSSKYRLGDVVAGWACKASMSIIERSARQLVQLADEHKWQKIVLPRAGCGAGELDWQDVRQVLSSILDDRFYVITY